MTRVLGIDPGFRHLGVVVIEWTPRVRRVVHHATYTTDPKMTDRDSWATVLRALQSYFASATCPEVVACEEMSGVRHGHNDRGTSSSNSDELLEVQGAIRALAHVYGRRLFLVRSQSSYAAMGARIQSIHGEKYEARKKRQKAANVAAACRLYAGAEVLTGDEADAAIHAGAVVLGKGVEA